MSRDRAAYMREYRKRKKGRQISLTITFDDDTSPEEIARRWRQAAEAAGLSEDVVSVVAERTVRGRSALQAQPFNTRPFTPVPKGK